MTRGVKRRVRGGGYLFGFERFGEMDVEVKVLCCLFWCVLVLVVCLGCV